MRFDLTKLFDAHERAFGKLSKSQADGLRSLITSIEADKDWPNDLRQIAYFLATIKHETANSFKPVKEKREKKVSPRRANQDRYWLTGEYGRGYVQITWDANYRKFGLGSSDRDKALEPATAYLIAANGMRQGTFTGKRLSNFFGPGKEDFVGARRIINGLDRAQQIAVIARKLQGCLSLALLRESVQENPVSINSGQTEKVDTSSSPSPQTSEASSPGLLQRAGNLFTKARTGYQNASESEKSVGGRVLQFIWTAIAGLVALIQTHPVQAGVAIAVLLIGAYTLHTYIRRQDKKTFLKLQQGGSA